jgi:hypothetical protein
MHVHGMNCLMLLQALNLQALPASQARQLVSTLKTFVQQGLKAHGASVGGLPTGTSSVPVLAAELTAGRQEQEHAAGHVLPRSSTTSTNTPSGQRPSLLGSGTGIGTATDVLAGGTKTLGPRLLALLDALAGSIKVSQFWCPANEAR